MSARQRRAVSIDLNRDEGRVVNCSDDDICTCAYCFCCARRNCTSRSVLHLVWCDMIGCIMLRDQSSLASMCCWNSTVLKCNLKSVMALQTKNEPFLCSEHLARYKVNFIQVIRVPSKKKIECCGYEYSTLKLCTWESLLSKCRSLLLIWTLYSFTEPIQTLDCHFCPKQPKRCSQRGRDTWLTSLWRNKSQNEKWLWK